MAIRRRRHKGLAGFDERKRLAAFGGPEVLRTCGRDGSRIAFHAAWADGEAFLASRAYIEGVSLTVKVEIDETGTYVAEVEELPGCVTQGTNFEDLLKNLREAISGNLETRKSLGYAVPSDRRMRILVDASV